jgi:hypothetical protein
MRAGRDIKAGKAGIVALLLALAMRLLVPTGFMWEPVADGGARLVPCTGMAPDMPSAHAMHHMAMAGSSHEKSGDSNDTASHECAFSGLGGPLDLADPFVAPAAISFVAVALPALVAQAVSPGRGLAAPPPPSRGPPATV